MAVLHRATRKRVRRKTRLGIPSRRSASGISRQFCWRPALPSWEGLRLAWCLSTAAPASLWRACAYGSAENERELSPSSDRSLGVHRVRSLCQPADDRIVRRGGVHNPCGESLLARRAAGCPHAADVERGFAEICTPDGVLAVHVWAAGLDTP